MSTSSLSLPAAPERVRPAALSFPRPELAVLLVAAGVLYLWALDRNGFANEYYSAAVRSMIRVGTRSCTARSTRLA